MTTSGKSIDSGGRGVIEVKLRDVNQFFNSMDPSPFPEKDLDKGAEDFIVSWAREFAPNASLLVRVHLPGGDLENERRILEEGLHSYFAYRAQMTQRKLSQLLTRGRSSLMIGLLFLAACLGAADMVQHLGTGAIFQIFKEGLLIGGWVAMWRPMEIFLYDWWPVRNEKRIYERLSRATVEVSASGT